MFLCCCLCRRPESSEGDDPCLEGGSVVQNKARLQGKRDRCSHRGGCRTLQHGWITVYVYGWDEQTDDEVFTVSDEEVEEERDRAE